MIKQSLLKRKPKSDVAMKFVGVLNRDKKDRPSCLVVPGSEGKQYHVILRRQQRNISAECRLHVGKSGHLSCPGNSQNKDRSKDTICYHSRAAIDFSLAESGMKASWCVSMKDAQRLHNAIGGSIFTASSHQNKAVAYLVVTK